MRHVHSRLAAALLLSTPCLFAQITPGNLLVSRVGDGAAPLTNAATARFLDEYTPAGVLVQTIALPTAASGANNAITSSGSATSEGFISQSTDARFFIAVGYNAAPGTAAVVSTASASTARVVARIDLAGSIDTTTALGDAYSGNNIRSGASDDGTGFWTAGTASTGGGVRYATLGATTTTQLSTTITNIRGINISNGQLFCSSSTGAFLGVSAVGSGLPTTSGQVITSITSGTGASTYDFFFADANTLYVADDRTTTAGGIQKWTFNGSVWALAYTLNPAASTGCRGLSGYVENGVTTLFATTTAATGAVVTVTDTGAGSTFTTLAIGAINTVLRDVQYVRTPSSQTYSGTACPTSFGDPTVGSSGGSPVIGNANFAITAGNAGPFGFVIFLLKGGTVLPFGVPLPGAPACALVYVLPDVLPGGLADITGAASTPVPIPAANSLAGLTLAAQVAAFDLSLVGFDIPVGMSNALQIVVGN